MPTIVKLKQKPKTKKIKKFSINGSKKKYKINRKRHYDKAVIKTIRDASLKEVRELRNSQIAKAFAETLAPKPKLDIDEWADQNRFLPQISAHEAGLWRTSRFPFLKRIMKLLSPSDPTRQVVVMKGAQLGFTEIALNWMFYTIDYNPAPMLYVQKTLDNISIFMDQRFDPAVEEMSLVKDKIGIVKTGRGTGNTKRTKIFPGGMIRFGGANSASSLRSMPIQYLILDEEDSYEQDIQEEGSPSKLAIARTRNFPNKKIFRLSTPTIKETSVIEPLFEKGTREYFYVPCPHCKHMEKIKWENIKWEKLENGEVDYDTVALLCKSCGVLIEERYKTWMLDNGKWIADNPDALYPSFHLSALYSPYGFFSWKEAVSDYIDAVRKGDPSLLKSFVNTILGETWSESGRVIKSTWLAKRKEPYNAEIPKDVVLLTSASDIQDNRIETEVVGWCRDLQSYSIDYRIFMGDTEQNNVWVQLDQFLMKWYLHEKNIRMPIAISALDSGYLTTQVYKFCRMREHRNIFPVKGKPGWGHGYIERPQKRNKYGVWAFNAYVDEIKSKIYTQLQIEEEGPGYCHFPDKDNYDTSYFRMLTAEKLEKKWKNGRYRIEWVLPNGRRNEALDARVLNIAALNILNPDFDSLPVNQIFHVAFGKTKTRKRKIHSTGLQ